MGRVAMAGFCFVADRRVSMRDARGMLNSMAGVQRGKNAGYGCTECQDKRHNAQFTV